MFIIGEMAAKLASFNKGDIADIAYGGQDISNQAFTRINNIYYGDAFRRCSVCGGSHRNLGYHYIFYPF